MYKIAAAVAAVTATIATVAIGSPAIATDYVQVVNGFDVTYGTKTYWPGHIGVNDFSGLFNLGSLTLDPGDTLTVDVMFSNPLPFPIVDESCCVGFDYQIIRVFNQDDFPIGQVIRPWGEGHAITNAGDYITGASIFFFASTSLSGFPLYEGVPMAGEYEFDFASTPEPGSWSLAILGVGCVGTALRRRRAASLACA
jgi:hypothetical protein